MGDISCPNCGNKLVQKNRDGDGEAIFGMPVIVKSGRVSMVKCRGCHHFLALAIEKSSKMIVKANS